MACMSALTTIAKLRPSFMGKVITALEALHRKFYFDVKYLILYMLLLIMKFRAVFLNKFNFFQ